MNIWLHNILCDFFYLFKTQGPVRVLYKDEKILGRKHIYLPHAQTAIYDSKVKLFLKRGISHQLGRGWAQLFDFECENSAIDVIINFLWKIFLILGGFQKGLFT
jgi:hypothetical protein